MLSIFAIPKRETSSYKKHAEVAQLVEHHLAKVRVAGSSLVFRSKEFQTPGFGIFCLWSFHFLFCIVALVVESVDARDLKSRFQQWECGFKSRPGHRSKPALSAGFFMHPLNQPKPFLMDRPLTPLYRKHNKLARCFCYCSPGSDFRHERNSKAMRNFNGLRLSIRRTHEGYDYTPLFKFLLSHVGHNWDKIFSEAVGRLDKRAPIFWQVDIHFRKGDSGIVRIGGNSYYSKLTVVDDMLVLADPTAEAPARSCTCCTHSFNGVPY